MWTIKYKGYYINGYFAKEETFITHPDCNVLIPRKKFISARAAQLYITRLIKALTKTSIAV